MNRPQLFEADDPVPPATVKCDCECYLSVLNAKTEVESMRSEMMEEQQDMPKSREIGEIQENVCHSKFKSCILKLILKNHALRKLFIV